MIRKQQLPAVTLILIVANLGAAFLLTQNPELNFQLGFRPDMPRFRDAITGLFLHANLFHLLANMVFLAAVGAAVELSTGSLRFAIVYFASGLAGVGLHFALTRHVVDPAPLVGASGAIAGCAAYYSVRYTSLRVPVLPNRAAPVAAVTAIWLVLQLIGGIVRFGDSGGVAYWAHLGGLAAGFMLCIVFRAPDLKQVKLGHEVLDRMNDRSPAAAIVAAKRHLQAHPEDSKALQDLARACAQTEDVEGESDCLVRLLSTLPETEHPGLLGRLLELDRIALIPPHRRLMYAEKFKKSSPAVCRGLLRTIVTGPFSDAQRPEALLALIGLEREHAPDQAALLLDELSNSYPLHPCMELARKRGWV